MSDMPEGVEAPPPGVHTAAIVRWTLVALMAIGAAASVVAYTGALHTPAAERTGVLYHCPMHPSIVQDHPGECPICGMTLVPFSPAAATADDGEHAGHEDTPAGLVPVTLAPERIQLLGMRTTPVTRATLAPEIRTIGVVAADETRRAQVHARFAGWIETLPASETGRHVRRGEVLATIYSPDLLTTQQELVNAGRWAAGDGGTGFTRDLVVGARRRLELLGVAPEDVAAVERSGRPLQAMPLRAPIDGYLVGKTAVQGLYVEPGTALFEVADLATVWVQADVYEADLARVHVGDPARFDVAAYPDAPFTGRVEFLAPTLDPGTRTVRIRLVVPNPDLRLRPGMYGDVRLTVATTDGLLVPREAVVDTGTATYVFLVRDRGRFEPRLVTLGARTGDRVEVRSGVAEGDVVVTTANFLLDSESRLRAALGGAPSHQHGAP